MSLATAGDALGGWYALLTFGTGTPARSPANPVRPMDSDLAFLVPGPTRQRSEALQLVLSWGDSEGEPMPRPKVTCALPPATSMAVPR